MQPPQPRPSRGSPPASARLYNTDSRTQDIVRGVASAKLVLRKNAATDSEKVATVPVGAKLLVEGSSARAADR